MYLSGLKSEVKELFLNFLIQLSSIDGDYSDEEKIIIENYCHEMKISKDLINSSIETTTLLEKINLSCSVIEKKIIIFEAIGLAMADSNYDENEKNLIMTIKDLEIDKKYYETCEELINNYLKLQEKINNVVLS